jgi:hypothetical protein
MDKFNERRQKGAAMQKILTPFYDDLLMENFNKGHKYIVSISSQLKYKCRFKNRVYEMNLDQAVASWSCGRWQLFRFPYSHACACISIVGRRAYEFCDPYFNALAYRNTYVPSISIIPTSRPIITVENCRIKSPKTRPQSG